jgi:hypothetical protein
MGSRQLLTNLDDPNTLRALAAISRMLSMLTAVGVTDPIELRGWALEGFVLR